MLNPIYVSPSQFLPTLILEWKGGKINKIGVLLTFAVRKVCDELFAVNSICPLRMEKASLVLASAPKYLFALWVVVKSMI